MSEKVNISHGSDAKDSKCYVVNAPGKLEQILWDDQSGYFAIQSLQQEVKRLRDWRAAKTRNIFRRLNKPWSTPAMDDLVKELRELIAALKDDIANGRKMTLNGEPELELFARCLEAIAWRSVEDGLPEKFEWVLIKIKYGDSPAVASLDKDSDWFVDTEHVNCDGGWDGCTTHSDIENGQVTHWKPITPKGGD